MKEQISALMDGELDDEESRVVLGKLKQLGTLRNEWEIYHMIGDGLRQTPIWEDGFSASFAERLAAEPTVLAPQPSRVMTKPVVAWSIAASLAAVSLVAWTSLQINRPDGAGKPAANQEIASAGAGIMPQNVDYYLNAHQEYSVAAVHGASPYLQASLERQQGRIK
jgi:sigma-E factor negative regulatory protein RseA